MRVIKKQAVHVMTQYASVPCKLTISLHLFARWQCCSGITISSCLFTRWHLFRHVGYLRHQQRVDLSPFDLESGVWVMWATTVTIFVFLGLSVLELGLMYVTDRQTDVRQEYRLMPPPYGGKGVINTSGKSTEWPMWNAVELKTKCLQACLQCIKKTYKGQIQLDIAQQVHTSHTNPSCSNKRRQRHNKHLF